MDSRDTFDLVLVVLAGLLAYTETFGFVDPRATISEIVAVLLNLDVRVYLLVGGVFGAAFVTYIVVYLPQKDARAVKP